MSKITTKIKGTTYYNIDYSKLKVGEKLYLVRDKQNIHDKNAIRVLYNEIMLGHIDKQVSTVLANIIDSGVKVKAVLSTILGGPPYENYGLLINISIYENRSENYYRSGTNVPFVENLESFRISESPVNIDIIYQNFSYDKKLYYKHKYKLDDEIIINVKPNFKEMYKSSHNIFENIFNLGIDNYIKDENMKWDKYIEHATKHNLDVKLKRNQYDKIFDNNDFFVYKKAYFMSKIFKKLDMTLSDDKSIEDDISNGYVTTYELLLYEKLRYKSWIYRQVIIKGYSIDFVLFNFDDNKMWAIEVDGGIHRTLYKFNKDNNCENELNKIGISLIRVSNSLISKNIENVVEKIVRTMNIAQ